MMRRDKIYLRLGVPDGYVEPVVYAAPFVINDALIASRGSNVFEGNWENTSYSAKVAAAGVTIGSSLG